MPAEPSSTASARPSPLMSGDAAVAGVMVGSPGLIAGSVRGAAKPLAVPIQTAMPLPDAASASMRLSPLRSATATVGSEIADEPGQSVATQLLLTMRYDRHDEPDFDTISAPESPSRSSIRTEAIASAEIGRASCRERV